MDVSFVYPCYNEAGNIEKTVRLTAEVGRAVLEHFEIIVVNDASTDGSGDIAESLRSEFSELVVLHHTHNKGLGGALRTGFDRVSLDWVLYLDSDLPIDILELKDVFPSLDLAFNELLIGYRLGRAEGPKRAVVSWLYNRMIRMAFGLRVRDVNFAFKMIPKVILDKVQLRSDGSFIDAELLLESMRQGARFRQRGFVYHPRVEGVSTIGGMRVVPDILRDMSDYRLKRFPRGEAGRKVIFNADDFGLNPWATHGVRRAIEDGVVRSVSIVPGGECFDEAAHYCLANPSLDVGVHLTLCEIAPLSDPADVKTLLDEGGRFAATHRGFMGRYMSGKVSLAEVDHELRSQVDAAVKAGLPVTHLDSHQHIHALPGIMGVVERIADDYGIAGIRWPSDDQIWPADARGLRGLRRSAEATALRAVLATGKLKRGGGAWRPDHFLGMTNAGRLSSDVLCDALRSLKRGVTEIACHPNEGGLPEWQSADELAALTGTAVPRALRAEDIEVTTYRDASAAK